jgi:transposase
LIIKIALIASNRIAMGRLSTSVKEQIIVLTKAGHSQREVSSLLSVARTTIESVNKKFSTTGSVVNKLSSGRPAKISPSGVRVLSRIAVRNRRSSLSVLTGYYNHARKTSVSKWTVRRHLHKTGFHGRAAAKKIPLSSLVAANRYQWCRERIALDINYWKNIIFSDESRFGFNSDGRVWVWRRSNERFHHECTVARNRTSQTVMFWGCITYDGVGLLIKCSNKMNANEYLKVLDMAAINVTSSCSLVYMQDNAPIHRARIVTDWLESNDVDVLQWPPYSPDINPIENVWSHIKDAMNRMCPKPSTLAELETAVQAIWSSVSLDYLQSLYHSMPKRMKLCVKARGKPIGY